VFVVAKRTGEHKNNQKNANLCEEVVRGVHQKALEVFGRGLMPRHCIALVDAVELGS
jgi:hypothetical protein